MVKSDIPVSSADKHTLSSVELRSKNRQVKIMPMYNSNMLVFAVAVAGFKDSLQSLDVLTPYKFDLPVDLAIHQFQNIKDIFT